MIYLFNESKSLFSIVSREELLSFLYEREVNALYQASVEMPVQSTDKNGLTRNLYNEMQNATYFGHYDLNDKFQLHKIVSIDVTGDSFITTAVHLFFDEAKALAVTEERRFIDRPIEDSVIYAFGLIGWTLDEFDISDAKTVSFFNDTVLEAQAKIIKTFGFKFDYWLDFDGQKITSKKVKVKEELGTQTHQRYVYGHNTLGIKMETDFSEIYTAVLGRGHGERIENLDDEGNETEDTFGRRIEFDEVEWSISSGDPLDKDLGERVLVDPVSTQIFGYVREDDTVAPRVKVVEFSDIEDKEDLLQASYDWLMENNSPKAVYSVEVLETEELDLGDEVYVVYRDIDFVKSARVSRVVDDLLTERRAVEFGDSDYFRRNSETSRLQRELQDSKNDSADYIQDLKRQANERIDQEMQQARDDFDQAWLEQEQIIEALELATQEEFTTQYNALYGEIQSTADATWQQAQSAIADMETDMQEEFSVWSSDLEDLRADYLASIVDINGTFGGIDTSFTNINDRVDNVFADVSDIQGFIGDTSENLNHLLHGVRSDFEDKISNINTWHYNLLRGSRFDENYWKPYPSGTSINTDEEINYYHFRPTDTSSNLPYVMTDEPYLFEAGVEYILSWDFQSFGVTVFDNIWLIASEDEERGNISIHVPNNHIESNIDRVYLGVNYRRYWIKFSLSTDFEGRVRIGSNLNNNTNGRNPFKIRLPYLTTSDRTQWMFHHMDNTQNLEEVTKRVTELEDGWETLITRTEYDFDTNEIRGSIRSIEDTVDGYSSTITNHENWFTTNGSNVLQTVDEVSSKVWKSDIHNPNMIPFADFDDASNFDGWSTRFNKNKSKTSVSTGDVMRIVFSEDIGYAVSGEFKIVAGQPYTFSVEILFHDNYNAREEDMYLWLINPDGANQNLTIRANYSMEHIESPFAARMQRITATVIPSTSSNNATIRIGLNTGDTNTTNLYFRRPKLEVGEHYTPFHNSFSSFEQRADQINLTVYGTDGLESTVAQQVVSVGQIEGLVTDADGKASQALQTVNGFENTVTSLRDTVNANVNLLPQLYSSWEQGTINSYGHNWNVNYMIRTKSLVPVVPSERIFFSNSNTTYRLRVATYDADGNWLNTTSPIGRNSSMLMGASTRYVRIILIRTDQAPFTVGSFIHSMKLEVGTEATITPTNLSLISQRADAIEMTVQDVDLSGVIRQSDVSVQPTGVTIGSAYLGENQLASMFKVMPNAIEAITEEMRLHGNLSVAGDIKGFAVEAVKADFGRVNSKILTSDVIKAEHIEVGNALIEKMFVEDLLVEKLITEQAFIANMSTITFDAITADVQRLRTTLFEADMIQANWLKTGIGLFDAVFSSDAMVSRLTSKTIFATDIRAIDLSANQVRVGFNKISGDVTINSSGVTIDGGALTVNRADGGVPTVIKGTNPNGITLVPATPPRRDSAFTVEGQYVTANTSSYSTFDFYLFEHMFTQVMVEVALINLSNNPITVALRVQGTDGSTFVGTRTYDLTTSYPGNTKFPRIIVNIPGKPTGQRERFFLQARTVDKHGKFGIHTYMVKHMDEAEGFERLEV